MLLKDPQGYLALVLHAHLPFVRHPEYPVSLEESWLFEAMTETYLRLFMVFEQLRADAVPFRISTSLTPPLASMLLDPLLQRRYLARLDQSIELARKEVLRTRHQPRLQTLARMYEQLYTRVRHVFTDWYGGNLLNAFRRFQDLGYLEILASAATHGYLPLLSVNPSAVRAQIRAGADLYTALFDRPPQGFWLPECGYHPGVDRVLADHGIRYTILETHGLTNSIPRPPHGVYAPVQCPSGLAVFGRDPDSSRQVWSSVEGYPGDFDYREFYRDIGHDLDLDYVRPYIHPDAIRVDTGIKYYRITGPDREKDLYDPEAAALKTAIHASHYLNGRIARIAHLAPVMARRPLILAPFDAELFGHWWWEGPQWIDQLIRKAAGRTDTIRMITLSDYLNEYPSNHVAQPAQSSWGRNGFSDVWLNPRNAWIYPPLHAAADQMESLAKRSAADPRSLDQAARELFLAQSSDWAFMINAGAMVQYAETRTRTHLDRFHTLAGQIESGVIDEDALADLESRDNLFPQIHAAAGFFESAPATAEPHEPVPRVPVSTPNRLRIALVASELVPFAKTGGLADMVAALAKALDQLGHRVTVILPGYRGLPDHPTLGSNIPVHILPEPRYFDRDRFYGYPDDAGRFAWFSRAALDHLSTLAPFDIIHTHDWQTALVNTYLKAQPGRHPALYSARTVFTIHNLGYQGLSPASDWPVLHLDPHLFDSHYLEFHGQINLLKAGLASADSLTTVSPSYAREIQTSEFGFGLEGVLQERAGELTGILNGVDYSIWNPATDPAIARQYSSANLTGKRACKADLQRRFQLALRPEIMLIGMVSRLVSQKGFDLLQAIMEEVLSRDLQFVLLGTGDPQYERFFRDIAEAHRESARVVIGFDDALAHRIEAGCDAFLMPSRYEPSGLNQLYSLKYGTLPIVRATGGLRDSVTPRNGFVFESYTPAALLDAIDRTLAAFAKRARWTRLMRSAMDCNHSWDLSAAAYVDLYRSLLQQ